MKTCQWCHQDFPLERFGRSVRSQDGRQRMCTPCIDTYRRVKPQKAAPVAPRRRRSPYENMAEVLRDIARVANDEVLLKVAAARKRYSLED